MLLDLVQGQVRLRSRPDQAALGLLGHAFPRVRKSVAEALYVRLLTLDELDFSLQPEASAAPAPAADAALALLADTAWDGSLAIARAQRAALHGLLGVAPSAEAAAAEAAADAREGGGARGGGAAGDGFEEDRSYGALVREMGY